jgi:hypothetical protein
VSVSDSRIAQAAALLDDARVLLADVEDGPVPPIDAPHIAGARRLCNAAVFHLNKVREDHGETLPGL